MRIQLISEDSDLHKLCREILGKFPGELCHLFTSQQEVETAPADLYIWDVNSTASPLEVLDFCLSRHLFLVNRKDLVDFRVNLGVEEANILLKPVTRATLSAFMGFAISAHEERISTANGLRAGRDDILQCLIQANLKLQEYDQDRTNFLARALHDFRAPLTAINGYCGLLLSEALGELTDEQQDVLQRMQHSAKRLGRMSSSMFQLSVGRHVRSRPNLAEADIRECLEQALHEIGPVAEGKAISISVELAPDAPLLHLETALMEQAMVNLLDNACKFTPKSGLITVRGYPFFWERRSVQCTLEFASERRRINSQTPNSYRIDIVNSGPPVPAEHLEDIFEEYTSYSGGQDRSGGGLGLAICKMIVAQHEGLIWAENTKAGPKFSFVLPMPAENNQRKRTTQKFLEYSEA